MPLEPQPFRVLSLLVARAGEAVNRDDIAKALWSKGGEGTDYHAISRSVAAIRSALGDDAKHPRYIATLRGVGYEFITPVEAKRVASVDTPDPADGDERIRHDAAVSSPRLVGRHAELRALGECLDLARSGHGIVAAVVGEAGFGKTSLVEKFLDEARAGSRRTTTARATCAQHTPGTEAYLPAVNALGSLVSEDPGGKLRDTLGRSAPIWSAQLAPSNADVKNAPQEQIKRQFVSFLKATSEDAPIVLGLDDLHWADRSTTELLAYLATEIRQMRVLVLLAYRPSQMAQGKHAFLRVRSELLGHQLFREIPVGPLPQQAVDEYIEDRFPQNRFPTWFRALVFAKTEGHPLFLANLIRDLIERQTIVQDDDGWTVTASMSEIASRVPDSAHALIAARVSRLTNEDRSLLAAAAVQGVDFHSTVVSDALSTPQVEVEGDLVRLCEAEALIDRRGEVELPDRTLGASYRFSHALYRMAALEALPPARRVELSSAIAQSLLARYGEQTARIAPQLAAILTDARRFEEAVPFCMIAAHAAAKMSAYFEVNENVDRGLALARQLDESDESIAWELQLLTLKGISAMALEGFSASQLKGIYERGQEIAPRVPGDPRLGPMLHMFWALSSSKGRLDLARVAAQDLVDLARSTGDPGLSVNAHFALGVAMLHQGEPGEAREQLSQARSAYDPNLRERNPYFEHVDPWVSSQCNDARAACLLGHLDEALRLARQAVDFADQLGHPKTVAYSRVFLADVHHFREEADQVLAASAQALALAGEQGLFQEFIWAAAFHAWALKQKGDLNASLAGFEPHVESYRGPAATKFLCFLAEALATAGQFERAGATIDTAIDLATGTGETYFEAELHRVKGEILLKALSGRQAREAAKRQFRRAIQVAEAQGATLLKGRARSSLDELLS